MEQVKSKSVKHGRLWTNSFILVTVANLLLIFTLQMLNTTLPVYIEELGGKEFVSGLPLALLSISAIPTRILIGRNMDSSGMRTILYIGVWILLLTTIGHFIGIISFILAMRLLAGVGWGIATNGYGTLAAYSVPEDRMGEGMSYFGLSNSLARALAPGFGIWIMTSFNFKINVAVAVCLLFIIMLLNYLLFGDKHKKRKRSPDDTTGQETNSGSGLFEKQALLPSVLCMFLAVTAGTIVSFIVLFGNEVGIAQTGLFFFLYAMMSVLIRPFFGQIFDKMGHSFVLIPGALSAFTGLVLLSYSHTLISFLGSAVLFGIGFGTVIPSLQAWAINRVPPNRRGVANGMFYSFLDIGTAIGSSVFGIIATLTNYSIMYRASSLMMVLFLVVYVIVIARERYKHQ